MANAERDQMSSAYRRLLNEIIDSYSNATYHRLVLLYLDEKGDQAEATCLLWPSDMLLKLRLVRRNELWYLVEVLQADSAYYVAEETLRPTIATIEKTRAAQKAPPAGLSDFVRVSLLLNVNPAKAIEVVDRALKTKPDNKGLLLLKARALRITEDRTAEGLKLLRELSDQSFAPAVYTLARQLSFSEDENEKKQAPPLFERYTSLEPRDPRGFRGLARTYKATNNLVKADAAYRKVIELDPTDTDNYVDFVRFLVLSDRLQEAKSVLLAGEKYKGADEDLFGTAVDYLQMFDEDPKAAEKFALSEPSRMKTSFQVNVTLGRIYANDARYADALRVLEIAAQLDKKSTEPYLGMSRVYRKQSRLALAVKAAQRAIDLDREDSEAYYQLACALTRLGRTKEAMSALSKSVELDEDQVEFIVDEPDLKGLASLPEFKKLIPAPVKQ